MNEGSTPPSSSASSDQNQASASTAPAGSISYVNFNVGEALHSVAVINMELTFERIQEIKRVQQQGPPPESIIKWHDNLSKDLQEQIFDLLHEYVMDAGVPYKDVCNNNYVLTPIGYLENVPELLSCILSKAIDALWSETIDAINCKTGDAIASTTCPNGNKISRKYCYKCIVSASDDVARHLYFAEDAFRLGYLPHATYLFIESHLCKSLAFLSTHTNEFDVAHEYTTKQFNRAFDLLAHSLAVDKKHNSDMSRLYVRRTWKMVASALLSIGCKHDNFTNYRMARDLSFEINKILRKHGFFNEFKDAYLIMFDGELSANDVAYVHYIFNLDESEHKASIRAIPGLMDKVSERLDKAVRQFNAMPAHEQEAQLAIAKKKLQGPLMQRGTKHINA